MVWRAVLGFLILMLGVSGPGASSSQYRVIRGGSWDNEPATVRSAHRAWLTPPNGMSLHGFRCAQDSPK